MFAAFCENHRARVLLSTSSITSLVSSEHGIIAHFVCHCGTPGTWSAI
jgi:hypothetical protein